MRRLSLMILSLCMFVLSGCATINSDIYIDNDGSGTWDATVTSQAGPLDKKTITDTLKELKLNNYTLKAKNDENKVITPSSDESASYTTWIIETKFSTMEELEDIRKSLASELYGNRQGRALEQTTNGSYIVDLGESIGTTTITVNGTIDPNMIGNGILKENTLTYNNHDRMRFLYKPSHGIFFYIFIAIGIIAITGIGYICYLRNKYYGKVF